MIIDQRTEPLGEVGVAMNVGAQGTNTKGRKLRCLLPQSKMQASLGMNAQSSGRAEEQLVVQVQVADPMAAEFVQHIPITYLATDDSAVGAGSFVQPMAYVLAENGYCAVPPSAAQEIILLRGVEASAGRPGPEPRVSAAKESQKRRCEDSECWIVKKEKGEESGRGREPMEGEVFVSDGENSDREYEMLTDEDKSGSGTKSQKKQSSEREAVAKRNKARLQSRGKSSRKASTKRAKEEGEEKRKEGKTSAEYKKEKQNLFELTKLEDNVGQVAERLKFGCECADSNCFDGLCPDDVFRHRLNIADLTKEEHDMYLMGVIMASIHNLEETCRRKERIRIRCCYAYQGKKVCLTAFLYLQHVTLYQMKILRNHLKSHGVSPRIHGNRGRKPANTLSLDIYQSATDFVQRYIEKKCVKVKPNVSFPAKKIPNDSGEEDQKEVAGKSVNRMTSYYLPPDCTKRCVHREYKSFCESLKHSQTAMKYSTFTNFLKKQFPNVKFHKREDKRPAEEQRAGGRVEEAERVKVKEEPGLSPKGVRAAREGQRTTAAQDCRSGLRNF